jgi:hypothetical protein
MAINSYSIFIKHCNHNSGMTLSSIVISVIQVNEGLIKFLFTCTIIMMKLCLKNFYVICVLSYHLTITVQMVVDCLVRRNLVSRNEKFILKLTNSLFIL